MPNKSAAIFLAGHGVVSIKRDVADDKLGSHYVILPAKLGGKLCYTAHNMISQSLMLLKTADEVYSKLQDLESVYGVSSVSIGNRFLDSNFVQFTDTSDLCSLSCDDHRQHLEKILQQIKDLEDLPMSLFDDPPDWKSLQSVFFRDVDFSQADIRSEIQNKIENSLKAPTDSVKAWKLREHALSCLVSDDHSINAKLLEERMYTPKEPYKPHSIVNFDSGKVLDLKIYINERKIGEQIATMHANEEYINRVFAEHENIKKIIADYIHDGVKTNLQIAADQAIYVTPSSPFSLSQILDILHNIHIFVSDTLLGNTPEVQFVCFTDNPQNPYEYDFTIPDDVNVVWGACRDVSTTDF